MLRSVRQGELCLTVVLSVIVGMTTPKSWAAEAVDAPAPDRKQAEEVSFHRVILPLLSSRCFVCHGPDEGAREAELRLDDRDDSTRGRDGSFVIKPGDPDKSTIIARLTSNDPEVVMPPPDSGHQPFTPKEVKLVRRWIAQGAQWSAHWAFVPPTRPAVPTVKQNDGIANPIDAFIRHRLEQKKLTPAPPANRVTLFRRLSLDLIGLPPTVAEIDAFLADASPNAYDTQVKRLLDSPHYGERWGRVWLDAARYADSDGFEKDKPREVWFYRDWVINALNRDLPYNQFIIEQIAGDLLTDATQDQFVATGFLRNSMLNEEGGIDPEEFRMQAMFDRMDTVGKSILGITVQCGQCHSHKYDPFSQRDYYRMFALINNCYEAQSTVYTPAQQQKRDELFRRIDEIEDQLCAQHPNWKQQMAAWEAIVRDDQPAWTVLPIENAGNNSQRYFRQPDNSLLAQGYAPTKVDAPFSVTTDMPVIRSFRLEVSNHPNLPAGGPGRAVDGMFALTEFKVTAASAKDPQKTRVVKFTQATADFSNDRKHLSLPYTDREGKNAGFTGPIEYAIDGDKKTAWGIDAGPGRRNQPRNAVFVADKNVAFLGGTKLTFTLSQQHGGWNSNDNQTLNLGRFRVSVIGEKAVADPLPKAVREIFKISPEKRTKQQQQALFNSWRTTVAGFKQANEQIEALWKEHPEGTTQFVLKERDDLRPTHMLERGDFLKPGDPVTPDVPGFLNPRTKNTPPNRLEFARWLVDRKSPTTARSIVNRIWQAYFGTGIVDTPEDLGSTGSPPSHPQLLDWLAVELMENNWSLKHIHRLIVGSYAYRQSSKVTSKGLAADAENRLLARGPRFRVDAEIVRDIFLTTSGLLNRKIGGKSVFPPAPAFLFDRPASYGPKTWVMENRTDKYRRALYTFRFRSVPYPALQAFDAPSGEIAVVRRSRSNTPLQALTTLNEPLFVECARALARTVLAKPDRSDEDRLTDAFRRCVARKPTEHETSLLLNLLKNQTSRFKSGELDPKSLLKTDANESSSTVPKGVSLDQLAAWTVVSRVLLNLDETITKE